MKHLVGWIPTVALVACAQTQTAASGPLAATKAEAEAVAPAQPPEARDAPTAKDGESDTERGEKVFQIHGSSTAGQAHGVGPSKIKPTKTEAALRLFVIDTDKGPIDGIVILLAAADGTQYFTEETDAKGYAEVLVPAGQTYDVVYLSLGRRDVSAKVTVENKPNYSLRLTLRYKRHVTATVTIGGREMPRFVLDGVQFESGKAILTRNSFARLDTVVEYMTHKKSARITISGHTDNVGNPRSNEKLSEKRAQTCRSYVVSNGIEGDRIEAVGYGDTQPIASNETEEGRQKNRRIEVVEQ